MANIIAYSQFNPSRTPDWRYDRVMQMIQREPRPGRCTRSDDEWVRGFRNFIVRLQNAEAADDESAVQRIAVENPGLYFAYDIHRRSFDQAKETFTVKARILAALADHDIAADMGTMPETLAWYEKLFFNVRDRLKSQDWIVRHVLYPSILDAETEAAGQASEDGQYNRGRNLLVEPLWDPRILWFAYFFGQSGVDFALTGFFRDARPNSQEDLENAYESFVRNGLGRSAGMATHAMEVNKYNVMELLSIYGQFLAIAKSDSDEAQKQTMLDKSVKAMLGDMPWAVGSEGAANVKGTSVERYDNSPVELRSDQLLKLSSGESLSQQDQEEIARRMKGLPPAPPKQLKIGQEDLVNANT